MIKEETKSQKIFVLFALLVLGFALFLGTMLYTALKPRDMPSRFTSDTSRAQRGTIISADGFHIASTRKLYKAMVNTRNIDPKKRDLFVELFSLYSGISQKEIRKQLNSRRGSVVLSYHIDPKTAQYLKSLAFELRRQGVFVEYETPSGRRILQGLNVLESGETREYPYGTLLTPVIGYPRKIEEDGYTRIRGIKGIEKQFDEDLEARQNGTQRAPRDVNNYMLLNKESFTQASLDGLSVKLNIPVTLQIRIEKIADGMKESLKAKEIIIAVMEAGNGKILSLASSNRFQPKAIRRSDYPALNTNAIEYSFEPGSVLKPLIFALLLEHHKVNPFDIVNCHGGRFKMGRKLITDEHKYDWLSAENVIVHSSNIGIAQLAQKLDAVNYYQGLIDFGLTRKSGIDLPYERSGSMPALRQLHAEIYKAVTAYGYGIRVNLIQLLKAYNAFNNSGRILTPQITESLIDERGRTIVMETDAPQQVLSPATAERMKKILIKTVNEGTGVKAITPGLEVGGKTGTAHIAEHGRYSNRYNTSFLGFANDARHRYTIGVTVVEPTTNHFASLTAVPVFKQVVDTMMKEGYLSPEAE
jgi:cell division protein FtsI (penicillin-binding protein 3)